MSTLHLGVIDIPHSDDGTTTTGEVAEDLEKRYGVMQGFMQLHEQDVAEDLADSMAGALESIMMGQLPSHDPFGSGTQKINKNFRTYLEQEEIAQLNRAGVPTLAALTGVSHRFKGKKNWIKQGKKKAFGVRRPSFIDTGQYMNVFTSWVTAS